MKVLLDVAVLDPRKRMWVGVGGCGGVGIGWRATRDGFFASVQLAWLLTRSGGACGTNASKENEQLHREKEKHK